MVGIIKTVGDLRRALSAYSEDAPLRFAADGKPVLLGTDMDIYGVLAPIDNQLVCVMVDLHSTRECDGKS